jgi:kynureninase
MNQWEAWAAGYAIIAGRKMGLTKEQINDLVYTIDEHTTNEAEQAYIEWFNEDEIRVEEQKELRVLNFLCELDQDEKQIPIGAHLEELLKDSAKTLVTLMHANNEIGTLIDLKKVSEICVRNGAYFHSDTVQTMGHYTMDVREINADFLTCSAHKFHGPKGIGFAYLKKNSMLPYLVWN